MKKKKQLERIHKRFTIFLYISIIAVLLHFFIPSLIKNDEVVDNWTLFTGMGIGLWFFTDFKMLRINGYYIKSLLIAIGFFFYGYLFRYQYQEYGSDLNNVSFIYPLSLLIVQYPTRQLYKVIFNREPKVERNGKFADFLYTIILFFGFGVLPFILLDYLY
ncbi:hypothetical protein [Tenacibaculum sp. 190130A14a]